MGERGNRHSEVEEGEMTKGDEKKLAEELFAHREDESEWSDKPEKLKVSRTPSVVYSIRFNRAELEELRAVADADGVSLAELIRRSVLTHVREADLPSASVSRVGRGLVLRWPNLSGERTQNREPQNRVLEGERESLTSATVV